MQPVEAMSTPELALRFVLSHPGVSVALSGMNTVQQVEETLEAERRARGELTREAWADLLRARPTLGFQSDEQGTLPARDIWDPEMVSAIRTGQTALARDGEAALAVPVTARGQVIGVIDAHLPPGAAGWTPEQQELLEMLALESAQLYREAQMLAARERLTAEITDRMRSTTDLDELLRTAIQETAAVLGASRAFVQWVPSGE